MKREALWTKNKKKMNRKPETYKSYKSRGFVDARNVLNQKRINKPKPPVFGSYMRTSTAKAPLLESQIPKKVFSPSKESNKSIQLSRDGNIIITSKSRNIPQMVENNMPKFNFGMFPRNRFQDSNEFQSSSGMDDLEHTAIEDVLDFESLPQSYINSKSTANLCRNSTMGRMLDTENLSRSSAMNQILNRQHTMVADQFSQYSNPSNKVFVSNLHSTVSRRDIMELFGDIGAIKSIEMGSPGSATVDFFNEEDAINACDIYHNRLLDGLPMKCYLKNYTPHRFALSQRLGTRKESHYEPIHADFSPGIFNSRSRLGNRKQSHYEPIHADFSPVIFNSRSRYNPHNVQFTVKLQ